MPYAEEILTVPGVQHAIVYENCTDSANTAGLPAHSIEAVVLGGQDMAIARAIWRAKLPEYKHTAVVMPRS